MEWLIIFVQGLLRMFTVEGDVTRPGLLRRPALAFARRGVGRQLTGQPRVDRTDYIAGYEGFPLAGPRLRCAPPAPPGCPDG